MQDALDYGEVLIEPPYIPGAQSRRVQEPHHTLIAYYEDDGVWWRHVIEIEPRHLLLKTVFDDLGHNVCTEDVLQRPGLKTVRAWSEQRWKNRPKGGK